MTPRDTTTGQVLENMIIPALEKGGYDHKSQVNIGKRVSGGRHIIDVLASKDGNNFLVSLKWQQVSGTAEQKVPFEVICLAEAVLEGGKKREFEKAYLVLGGEGWSLRDFYTEGGLESHLSHSEDIDILTLESFIALANSGEL